MMNKLFQLRPVWLLVIYLAVDTLCIGMGMGVPIFCILLGFPVGWLMVRYITSRNDDVRQIFTNALKYAIIFSAFTFLAMLILWGPFASNLFDPSKDLANTGIPMILFEPRASFIGWIVLMILISPFLQLLTSLFSAYVALLSWMKKAAHAQKAV